MIEISREMRLTGAKSCGFLIKPGSKKRYPGSKREIMDGKDCVKSKEELEFHEILVDFLILKQQREVKEGKDLNLIISKLKEGDPYVPDKKTYSIIHKLVLDLPVYNEEEQVLDAFYKYFDDTIQATTQSTHIDSTWVDKIKGLIDSKLLKLDIIDDLLLEVDLDFIASCRLSTVQYILLNRKCKTEKIEEKRTGKLDFGKRKLLEKKLLLTHPLLQRMIQLWQDGYKNIELFDINTVLESRNPFRLSSFRGLILNQCEEGKIKIWDGFLSDLIHCLSMHFLGRNPMEKPGPGKHFNPTKLPKDNFFKAFYQLLNREFIHTTQKSLVSFLSLFLRNQPQALLDCPAIMDSLTSLQKNPMFIIRLTVDLNTGELGFDPSVTEFKTILLEVMEILSTKIMENIPIFEKIIFDETLIPVLKSQCDRKSLKSLAYILNDTSHLFSMKLGSDFVDPLRKKLENVLDLAFLPAIEVLDRYSIYSNIFTLQVEESVREYSNFDHPFHNVVSKIEYYRELKLKLYDLSPQVEICMFEVHVSEAHRRIHNRIDFLVSILVEKIVVKHREKLVEICSRYDSISENSLKVPESFKEMEDQIVYMQDVALNQLPDLVKDLESSFQQMLILAGHTTIAPDHLALNSTASLWATNITPYLEKYDVIINGAKIHSMEILKERRTKFISELEDFNSEVDQLKEDGDFEEIQFYSKKAQQLQKHLLNAQDTISSFNKEEELYNWEVSSYPLRKQILSKLQPLLNFYTAAINFQKSYKKWLVK